MPIRLALHAQLNIAVGQSGQLAQSRGLWRPQWDELKLRDDDFHRLIVCGRVAAEKPQIYMNLFAARRRHPQ
jgi:hypothetical protein